MEVKVVGKISGISGRSVAFGKDDTIGLKA